jgi:hypothetical protein
MVVQTPEAEWIEIQVLLTTNSIFVPSGTRKFNHQLSPSPAFILHRIMSSILLQGGTALIHNASDHVKAVKTDILIKGNNIVGMGPNLHAPESSTEIIDCTDKIISPGFVDTHHHMWQTQLKGRHGNEVLLEYYLTGMFNE